MLIHLRALSLTSGGPFECLIREVKLEFGGWLGLEVDMFGVVHRVAIVETYDNQYKQC